MPSVRSVDRLYSSPRCKILLRKTPIKYKALLEDLFRLDNIFNIYTLHLRVTDHIAQDIKGINHGFNNDLSYDACHRGVSLFMVIGASIATVPRCSCIIERHTRPTNFTLAEVESADTSPNPIPTGYRGLVNLLQWLGNNMDTRWRWIGLLPKSSPSSIFSRIPKPKRLLPMAE